VLLHELASLLLAQSPQPPQDLALWIGTLFLTAIGSTAATRFATRGDKADAERKAAEAEWKAEIRGDLKRLLDGQSGLLSTTALQAKDISAVSARCEQIEKRQEAQAAAHRDAISSFRSEVEARISTRGVAP